MVYLSSSLRSGYPRAIADEEFREIGHLCIILAPIRLVTKALEGESPCTAALNLPLHQLRDTWKASNFKVPSKLVPFFKEKVAKKDLSPLAQKLALFFLKDLEKIQQRHMAGTAPLLRMCTFCDPRFLKHPCMDAKQRGETSQAVVQWAFDSHEKGKDIATHPDNRSLAQLAAESSKGARGRGGRRGGRGRGGPRKQAAAAPSCPKPVKKRILKQRDSSDDFLFGASSRPSGTLVDEEMAADEAKIRQLIEAEMGRYESMPAPPPECHPCDWWLRHAAELPNLARVARMLQSIPGSSAAVERAFSAFARIADRKRPRLKQKRAAALLYAHENLKRGWTGETVRSKRDSMADACRD